MKVLALAISAFVAMGEPMDGIGGTCDKIRNPGNCKLWGDPHYTMWNGAKHDIMGDKRYPLIYHVARCAGVTVEDMPVQILGYEYPWPTVNAHATGLDFFVLELYHDPNTVYYVYFSYTVGGWAFSGDGATPDYDRSRGVKAFSRGTKVIGGRYKVTITRSGEKATLVLDVDNGDAQITIHAHAEQMYRPERKRKPMNTASIQMDESYACFVCGLCGSMKKTRNPLDFEKCDGTFERIRNGWTSAAEKAIAFRANGMTYEWNWYNKHCGEDDIPETPQADGRHPCDGLDRGAVNQVQSACRAVKQRNGQCCAHLGKECDNGEQDCIADACNALFWTQDANAAKSHADDFAAQIDESCQEFNQGQNRPHQSQHGAGDGDLFVYCDNSVQVFVDGQRLNPVQGREDYWPDLKKYTVRGVNQNSQVSIQCKNVGGPGGLMAAYNCGNERYVTGRLSKRPGIKAKGQKSNWEKYSANGGPWRRPRNGKFGKAEWVWDGSRNTKTLEWTVDLAGKCGLGDSSGNGGQQNNNGGQQQGGWGQQQGQKGWGQQRNRKGYSNAMDVVEPEDEPFEGDFGSDGDYVFELTKEDLVIVFLVLANLAIVAATTCICLAKKNKSQYSAVKAVYTSDEEAASQLVE